MFAQFYIENQQPIHYTNNQLNIQPTAIQAKSEFPTFQLPTVFKQNQFPSPTQLQTSCTFLYNKRKVQQGFSYPCLGPSCTLPQTLIPYSNYTATRCQVYNPTRTTPNPSHTLAALYTALQTPCPPYTQPLSYPTYITPGPSHTLPALHLALLTPCPPYTQTLSYHGHLDSPDREQSMKNVQVIL